MKQARTGFTIVELLIVIVVIGILAAITIVAYNGVQNRARDATVNSDLANSGKRMMAGQAINNRFPTTLEANSSTDYKLKLTADNYKLAAYCVSDNGFAIAAESKSGSKFYIRNNGAVVRDDTVNVLSPCVSLGIQNTNGTAAAKIFMGLPASGCAGEGGTCTFSGTATIAYGSLTTGNFNALANQTSPVTCNNTVFGDPAAGYTKTCYVLNY